MAINTLFTDEVAKILGAETSTIAQLARLGELPAATIGRSYVFLEDHVEAYLRRQIEIETSERREKHKRPAHIDASHEVLHEDVPATENAKPARRGRPRRPPPDISDI